MNSKPSYKQIKFLLAIENDLEIKCEGITRKEGSDFISKNIDAFYESKEKNSEDLDSYEY